jgi:hypothetical protein
MAKYDEMLKANLMHMLEVEETDPAYYGPRILEMSNRLEA